MQKKILSQCIVKLVAGLAFFLCIRADVPSVFYLLQSTVPSKPDGRHM